MSRSVVWAWSTAMGLSAVVAAAGCSFDYETASPDGGPPLPADAEDDSRSSDVEGGADAAETTGDSMPESDVTDGVPDDAPDVTGPPDAAPSTCAALGGKTYGGHCYWPIAAASTQAGAIALCKAADPGGHLVTITSAAEQTFAAGYAASGARWIGLQAKAASTVKADFTWITLEPKTVEYWSSTAPSGAGACVRMNSLGQWVDRTCAGTSLVLCERDSP